MERQITTLRYAKYVLHNDPGQTIYVQDEPVISGKDDE
jgi:hypothetical protein